jgi:hypothetical protein
MRAMLVAAVLGSMVGCNQPVPCEHGTCTERRATDYELERVRAVWSFYGERGDLPGPIWIVSGGDCPDLPTKFIDPSGACAWGYTGGVYYGPGVGSTLTGIWISTAFRPETFAHELYHAHLMASRIDDSGDTDHSRAEWQTVIPQAMAVIEQMTPEWSPR